MLVTIPEQLRKTLFETTAPAYLHYPNQSSPQNAYVTLDLRDVSLGLSHALQGGSERMDEYQGIVRRFYVSPYAHGASLLAALEELLPELQEYADLLEVRWDGSNMSSFLRAGRYADERILLEERIDKRLEDIPEVAILTPDWYNPRDFLCEMPASSPAEIAREIVHVFQDEFPLNHCDVGAVEDAVRDVLQRCISENAEYTAITFLEDGGIVLELGDDFKLLYDKPAEATKDYQLYIIDGSTEGCHQRGEPYHYRPEGDTFRGDEAEAHAVRTDYDEIMSDETTYDKVENADELEFFRLLRHARGLGEYMLPREILNNQWQGGSTMWTKGMVDGYDEPQGTEVKAVFEKILRQHTLNRPRKTERPCRSDER